MIGVLIIYAVVSVTVSVATGCWFAGCWFAARDFDGEIQWPVPPDDPQ